MKRFRICVIFILVCVLLTGCVGNADENERENNRLEYMLRGSVVPVINDDNDSTYKPLNYDIQKSVWLSYIDLSPMLTGKSERDFSENFESACKNISQLGCNTVYLHLRPFGDAIYNSELYPYSKYITGTAGKQGDYDPLEIMLDIAHRYKLSVHGWLNPLRCENESCFENYDDSCLIKEWYNTMDSNECIRFIDGDSHLWLNPACEEVRKLIADGAAEICENYEIDGIHYDDYFYPTTDKSFDTLCYQSYNGSDSLEQWRLDNINEMVMGIYSAVKAVNKNIIVGASPQGNIENNYAYMYADVKTWCSCDGYIDYICPQIYYGYDNSVKPFLETLQAWKELVTDKNVSLVTGLAVYKIFSDENEFYDTDGIIAEQISDSLETCSTDGIALYNYISLFEPEKDFEERIATERDFIQNALK